MKNKLTKGETMKKQKIISAMAAVMVMVILSVTPALAEYQKETPSYSGQKVTCVLNCEFSLIGNDRGNASTSWNGKKKHKVRVMLFSCPNAVKPYKIMDDKTGGKSASVSGSKKGVWRFKSQHYVVNASSNRTNVCVITDW